MSVPVSCHINVIGCFFLLVMRASVLANSRGRRLAYRCTATCHKILKFLVEILNCLAGAIFSCARCSSSSCCSRSSPSSIWCGASTACWLTTHTSLAVTEVRWRISLVCCGSRLSEVRKLGSASILPIPSNACNTYSLDRSGLPAPDSPPLGMPRMRPSLPCGRGLRGMVKSY